MKTIIKNFDFNKQIQKLNLSIEEQKLNNNSNKKNLVIYIKGLKFFYYLIFKFISKWNGQSKNLFNIILSKNSPSIKASQITKTKAELNDTIKAALKDQSSTLHAVHAPQSMPILGADIYCMPSMQTEIDKIKNLNLIFKGQSSIDSISKIQSINLKNNNSINEINTREYIKSLTKFESNNAYSFSNNYNYKFFVDNNRIPKNINIFLEYSFLSLFYLISKPFFEITPDKITIHLFCFQIKPKKKVVIYKQGGATEGSEASQAEILNKKIISLKDNVSMLTKKINRIKLQIISRILRKIFKKTVELEIVRLHYPFYNTNIFVNLLGKMINKIKFRRILRQFFNKAKILNPTKLIGKKISKIPSFISGIKFKIAGRLLTQRIVPRQTVKIISRGSLARNKVIYLEKGRFTNKNKRGAFSITVTTGHIKI